MPSYKLVTEVLPKKIQVLITYPNCPLGKELIRQLQIYPHLEIVTTSDPTQFIPDLPSLGAVIHLAGFASPSLSETLAYTSFVYKLLTLSHSSQAKFLLVLANTRNHLYHTAVTLVGQYAKNFPLSYQILEIDKTSSVSVTAAEIIQKFVHHHRLPPPVSPALPRPTPVAPRPHRRIRNWLLLIGSLILLPWAALIIQLAILLASFACTVSSLRSLDLPKASSCARISLPLTSALASEYHFVLGSDYLFSLLGLPPSSGLTLVSGLSTNVINLSDTNKNFSLQLSKFLSQADGEVEFSSLKSQLSDLSESLARYQSDLRGIYVTKFRYSGLLAELAQIVSQLRATVSQSQTAADSLPLFLSVNRHTNYLIFIQDSSKLDTFAYLTADDGKIVNLELFTSKSSDSQLRGQISPPSDFQIATGQTQWLLRDSSWDPDFPTTAKRVAWFIDKELSRPVDLIISLNLHSLAQVLSVIGPVTVPDLDLAVSSPTLENQYLSYLGSHPQSDQFIFKTTEKIVDELKSLNQSSLQRLSLTLLNQLISREIFIYAPSNQLASLNQLGWSGGVALPNCRSASACVSNYFYPTNTNLGINKADAYMSSKTSLSSQIDSQGISSLFTINYTNPAVPSAWPAGIYKNYFRLYFSSSSVVNSVSLNGETLPTSRYKVSDSFGLKLLSVPFEVPPGTSSQLAVSFSQTLSLSQFHYQLDIPHQSGASISPMTVEVTYPKSWYATALNTGTSLSPSVASPGRLGYNTATTGNPSVDIDFTLPGPNTND